MGNISFKLAAKNCQQFKRLEFNFNPILQNMQIFIIFCYIIFEKKKGLFEESNFMDKKRD